MREPLYRQALKSSWHLLWEHKTLWVFGVFAAFLGQMGLLDLLSKVGLAAAGNVSNFSFWISAPRIFAEGTKTGTLFSVLPETWLWIACMLVLFFGIVLLWLFVSVVSQGTLIKASAEYVKRGTVRAVGRAWQSGVKHFWPLLGLQIVKRFLLMLLAAIVGYAALNALLSLSVWSLLLFLLLFILAAALGMVVAFLVVYAAGYLIIEEYHWRESVVKAWRLFVKHWLVSVEVGLIVLALNVVTAMLAVLGFFIFFLPTLITWFIAVLTLNSALWWAGLLVGILFSTLLMIFLGALLTVYTTSVWTYLFMKMHHEGISSRLLRWLKK